MSNTLITSVFLLTMQWLLMAQYYTDEICAVCTTNCVIGYSTGEYNGEINITLEQLNGTLDAYLTDLDVYVHISHEFPEDLDAEITFGGTTLILFNDQQGTGTSDVRSYFSSDGRTYGGCMSCEDTMKPAAGSFDAFLNEPILSNSFHLNVLDDYLADDGTIHEWCVTVGYSYPTSSPTLSPSENPTNVPTTNPTNYPSSLPSKMPTETPFFIPSMFPSSIPSDLPSTLPSNFPTMHPTINPTDIPSEVPSKLPSMNPTHAPNELPSVFPTILPSKLPTTRPSISPSAFPTLMPSMAPHSISPTITPTEFWEIEYEFELAIECVTTLRADIAFLDHRHLLLEPIEQTFTNLTNDLVLVKEDFRVYLTSIGPYPVYDVHTRRRLLQSTTDVWNYTLRFDVKFQNDSLRFMMEKLSQTNDFLDHLLPLYETTFNDDNLVLVLQSPSEITTTEEVSTTEGLGDDSKADENENSEQGLYIGILVGLIVFAAILGALYYHKTNKSVNTEPRTQMTQVMSIDMSSREPTMLTNEEMTENESRLFHGSVVNPFTKGPVSLVDTPSIELQSIPERRATQGGPPQLNFKLSQVLSEVSTPGGQNETPQLSSSDSDSIVDVPNTTTTVEGENTKNITLPKAPVAPMNPITRNEEFQDSSESDSDLDVLNTATPGEDDGEVINITIKSPKKEN